MSAGGWSRTYCLRRSLSSDVTPLFDPPTHAASSAHHATTTKVAVLPKKLVFLSIAIVPLLLSTALATRLFLALALGLLRILLGRRERLHLGQAVGRLVHAHHPGHAHAGHSHSRQPHP